MRGLFDNPASGLLPMALQVTHDQLSGILISPFFSEWTNFDKERPCRAVLLVEVPQFIGDRGWLDKELVGCFGQTLAHSRNIDHGIDQDVLRDVDTARSEVASGGGGVMIHSG